MLLTVVHSWEKRGPWCALRWGECHNGEISVLNDAQPWATMWEMCTSLLSPLSSWLTYTPRYALFPLLICPFLRNPAPTNGDIPVTTGRIVSGRVPPWGYSLWFWHILTFLINLGYSSSRVLFSPFCQFWEESSGP